MGAPPCPRSTLPTALLRRPLLLSFLALSLRPAAHAADEAPAATEPPASAPAAPAPAASAPLGAKQVPRLVVRWSCGECTHNEKVPPLIEEAYVATAAA